MGIKSFIGLIIWALYFHPVHVSVMNIEYNEKEKQFHCVLKAFRDDLSENIARNNPGLPLLPTNKEVNISDEILMDYIHSYIAIKINKHDIDSFLFDKLEMDEESIWIFFNFHYAEKIKSVELQNRVMMDMFEDQTNLVIINIKEKEKGFSLNAKSDKACLRID
ncbi:MAG: DUF6702 family protein [Bacteroidales bacterium]